MSPRRSGRDIHGILLLDKPEGWSSSQAVQRVRWLFQARKAGHTGSLDPVATGMLPICLGEASKTAAFMLDAAKTYVARAILGAATATGDTEGEVVEQGPVPQHERAAVEQVLARFRGRIRQVPPMYSALKHQGQPLYRLARAGVEVPRESREVTVHALDLLRWEPPVLEFRVHCSKGTYVRTLAEDIARALDSCGHLQALRRLAVEPFEEREMVGLEALVAATGNDRGEDLLLPVDAGLRDWPVLGLNEAQAGRFRHGNPVPGLHPAPAGAVRVYGPEGRLLGLGELSAAGQLKARRLMNLETARR